MKLKNVSWDLYRFPLTDMMWSYQANEWDYGGPEDSSLLYCLVEDTNANDRVMVQRSAEWEGGTQLKPWKQLFIGYAKNALIWAKQVTGVDE